MKDIIIVILVALILGSCSNDNTNIGVEKKVQIQKTKNQNINSKKNEFEKFTGVWVLSNYIEEIKKTHSPLKSSITLQGLVTLIIENSMNNDSIIVGASLNNHEGDMFTVYSKKGSLKNTLITNIIDYEEHSNSYEIGYKVNEKDTSMFLYHLTPDNKIIEKKEFVKVANKQDDTDAGWGIQKIVNKEILSGNITLIDSTEKLISTKFNIDGTIEGYPDLKTYYILTDFAGSIETYYDGLCFNLYTENQKCYAMINHNDTIYLYTTIEEKGYEKILLDKVMYKLIKNKIKTANNVQKQ